MRERKRSGRRTTETGQDSPAGERERPAPVRPPASPQEIGPLGELARRPDRPPKPKR